MRTALLVLSGVLLCVACDDDKCVDHVTLVATNAGSPSGEVCSDQRQHMRVEVQSSTNGFAALVFCECERVDGGK